MVIFRKQKNFGSNVIYFVAGTLLIAARLTFLDDVFRAARFLRIPPGFHPGVRAMDWPLPGRVWEVSGRGPLPVKGSFYRKRRKSKHKDVPRGTPTRSTARRGSADPSAQAQ